jgi:glycosyltransferase involved in cell wall biosynthesis
MVKHYAFVTFRDGSHFAEMTDPKVNKPGSGNWYRAFNAYPNWTGELRERGSLAKDDFENFDIIHLTLAGVNVQLVKDIREVLGNSSSTLLILSNDYAFENFENGFEWPTDMHEAAKCADFIFIQEPTQLGLWQHIVKEYIHKPWTVPVIPHPVNTEALKALYVKPENRLDMAVYVYHKYERQIQIPSMLLDDLGIPTLMMGYLDAYALRQGRGQGRTLPAGFFNFNAGWLDWPTYSYILRHCTVGLEYYVVHSYGRVPQEYACLGIPAVCSNHSYTSTILYPGTCFSPYDLSAMRKSLERLVKDQEFWKQTADYASEKVETMNWQHSVENLLKALEEREFKV